MQEKLKEANQFFWRRSEAMKIEAIGVVGGIVLLWNLSNIIFKG